MGVAEKSAGALTIERKLPEVAGVAQTGRWACRGLLIDVDESDSRSLLGLIPSGSVYAHLLPDGYLTAWKVKEGDMLSDGERTIRVSSFSVNRNPRTLKLHHIGVVGVVA